ncbi:MAG: hypothetical protein V4603_12380, partial [Pseudomonadota bacterium]
AIAAGDGLSLALRDDGTVWAIGMTGYNSMTSRTVAPVPMQVAGLTNVRAIGVGFSHRIAILADGSVYTWGMNDVGQLGNGQSGNFSNTPSRVPVSDGVTLTLKTPAPSKTDVDRLFNWAESVYPHMFPVHVASTWISGYYARCYSTGLCVGEGNGRAYLYNGTIRDVGGVEAMLNAHAIPAGF